MCTRICLRPAAFASASRSSVRCLLSVPGTESKLRNEAYDGVAVVIGGSRGIGLAFTSLLLDESKFRGHVFVLSRSPAASAELCALANHQRCTVVQVEHSFPEVASSVIMSALGCHWKPSLMWSLQAHASAALKTSAEVGMP